MGVQGLWKLLECTGRPINPETLEGKILAVDISIWLNQALKGARDRQGNAIQNAHLLTLFHRLCKLLFFRIRPIFVFDGEAPLLKKQTLAKRRQKKDVAASEAKKTNDKLLRTFLKRQAIKAALSGNKQSNSEDLPSLPHVRQKEEEDIYALPPLEEKDKNSSEEEEDKEWEERMNEKRILQEEFFADPHAVDIESEDFIHLPPEVKHEILTDMKEFTKRRRTLFETMPEDSNDFSQYQLKGLLKKNNLNKCLDNVRKEMNQQYSGEVRAQFEKEGGFMKDVETRRLVSEDTSHYILIKGIQSKKDEKKEEISEEPLPSSSSDVKLKTYLDVKLASAHKSKKPKDSPPEAAPPSPRTLFAIQEAMVENSSDEEIPNKSTKESYKLPSESLGAVDGNISPRTLHAIQQALAEDEVVVSRKRSAEITDENEEKEQPKAKVLIISSSDEEDHVLGDEAGSKTASIVSLANVEFSPSPTHGQKINNDKAFVRSSIPISKQGVPSHISNASKVEGIDMNVQIAKRNLFHSQDVSVKSSFESHSSFLTEKAPQMQSLVLESSKPDAYKNVDDTILRSSETESFGLESCKKNPVEITPTKNENILQPSHSLAICNISPSEASVHASTLTSNVSVVPDDISSPALLLPEVIEGNENSNNQQPSSSNVPDITYIPMTPESISVSEAELGREKEIDSDSDGSFIEVESDLENSNSQLIQATESPKDANLRPNNMDSAPTGTAFSSSTHLESSFNEDKTTAVQDSIQQQKSDESGEEEAAGSEWQDISVEELESLENNLFVQQTSLQAQKQQQERVAASVTGQMCLESQELLRLFGIPFIVAPMEAEAQCALLDLTDQTSGTITDDSDIWLFGARHVYKNFFSQSKYVEYYQFSDLHNQLGLDRSKLINLAYLMGSDYTEGIPSVGYVSAMEILNEFPGHGIEPLVKFKEWWEEAQKNKKIRPNPHDTKVKKKLRDLVLHPSFPNQAVANAYLRPTVDESEGAFAWGRPDLEQIREFCESRFGWYRSKTDDLLLPVLKQLSTQQTQLRIDSFFRVEQHEAHGLKSQRLRRAVTCMKRKDKEHEVMEVEEGKALMEKECANEGQKDAKSSRKSQKGKKKNKAKPNSPDSVSVEGGFLGTEAKDLSLNNDVSFSDSDNDTECKKSYKGTKMSMGDYARTKEKTTKVETSSSSEEEESVTLVTAKPVFQGNTRKARTTRGRKK